ncbi:polyphenol oxidase family protein [Candidatus Gracilibacteria bacterium]|nr:polyphenol oxidase family protein [Candidatus Gracilibacteria bacterium]
MIHTYEILKPFEDNIGHAVFDRTIDPFDTSTIQKLLGSKEQPYQFTQQLHGTKHYLIKELPSESRPHEGDILLTQIPQLPLIIRVADCGSIFFYDPEHKAIANVHAGWRGIAQKIIPRTIDLMQQAFSTDRTKLIACLSPMVGPCCTEFTDPKTELPSFLHAYILEENYVDLWGAVEGQLIGSGIPKENIEIARICTVCTPEHYHSYRRDKENAGRFCTGIMLKA